MQGQKPKILEAINLFKCYRNIEKYCGNVLQSKSNILSKWAFYDNILTNSLLENIFYHGIKLYLTITCIIIIIIIIYYHYSITIISSLCCY
jgi:hypothetical protein